jgi:hypothetical protein
MLEGGNLRRGRRRQTERRQRQRKELFTTLPPVTDL